MILSILLSALLWTGASVQELSAGFKNPPQELASHVIWGWEGDMAIETVRHDLDSIKSKGFRSVIFEAGYHLPYGYLSDDWFKAVRTAVMEAKARELKVWIIDEGKYPSGFAGGKFTRERPDLRMKALVVMDTIKADKGKVITGLAVPGNVISAVAVSRSGATGHRNRGYEVHSQPWSESAPLDRTVEIKDGRIDFCAGQDSWDILLVGPDFRTGQTRAVCNADGRKDTANSQCDYLNPAAVRQFIDWTHEQYKRYIGDEFGKTVLGFRGDEPDFTYLPWTDSIVTVFKARKGYDPTPYLGSLLGRNPDTSERRFKADYWDVWSELFSVNFFKQQADWCEQNGISYITHLNKDHNMPECIRVSGDFFRDLKHVQVPGVDAIWNQIWPGVDNDFPKFASSVSHVYGKQRAFSESFAAYYTPPTIPTARYAVDYQMARGINFFEFMFWMAGSTHRTWMTDPGMEALNDYTNRATYLLTQGIPGARIAVYYPSSTIWMGDRAVSDDLVKTARLLMTHQRDFDWVSDDAFRDTVSNVSDSTSADVLKVKTGALLNRSGQKYYTLIIPSCEAVSREAWDKIEEFALRGGRVLMWGRKPQMIYKQSFTDSEPVPQLEKNCFEEPTVEWTPTVAAAMPEAEFTIDNVSIDSTSRRCAPAVTGAPANAGGRTAATCKAGAAGITYTRRHLTDGDIWFITNESEYGCSFTATLDGCGTVREWDCYSGTCSQMGARKDGAVTHIDMTLKPWESRFISINRESGEYNVRRYGVRNSDKPQTAAIQAVIDKAYADGGGTVVFPAGKYISGALFFPAGVSLKLSKNALLKGTAAPEDYPLVQTRFEGIDREWRSALLNFNDSPGVKVSGEGTVDGNGLEWNNLKWTEGGRPRLICFNGCDGGSISGLKLLNQASWCLHVLYTQGFDIDNLYIQAQEYIPSSDGIDIDSSSDVHVSGCYISVHDDCISIKSGRDAEGRRVGKPSEDILVEDCHFGHGHGSVTIGSEISGDVRNVTTRRCLVDEGNWAPIRFKSQPSRGGIVENILFEDITVKDVHDIFDIFLEWRPGVERNKVFVYSDPVTRLRNITFRNVHGSGKSMGKFSGFEKEPLEPDVFRFENCSFSTEKGLTVRNARIDPSGLEFEVTEGPRFISPKRKRPDPVAQAKEVIERIYNYLDGCTPYTLVDGSGKDIPTDAAGADSYLKKGEFLIYSYEWGVTYSGFLLAGKVLSEGKYLDYVYDRLGALGDIYHSLKPIVERGEQTRIKYLVTPHWLDDCGSMCAAMSKATIADPSRSSRFRDALERWFRFCMHEEYRLPDGTLARHRPAENSVWLDDMYMGITPIAFRGALAASEADPAAGDCYAEAIRQVGLFGKYLWVPEKSLYRHGWIEGMSEHPNYHWARCNGWALLTMCDLLDAVPEGTAGRDEVLEQFRTLAGGIGALQAPDGRWHQLLDKDETYLETSATAIFTYCIAHGINEGWLDRTAYQEMALAGWRSLIPQVNDKGQVENTCVGTGLGWSNAFYAGRPVNVHAHHGYGPVLLAAAEIIRMSKKL